jgi:transposase InsO family protein
MTKRASTEMAAEIKVPADRYLQRIHWTEPRARNAPYIRFKEDGTPWIGDRRVVYTDDQQTIDQVLATAYRMDLPPAIGVRRFYSWILRRYIGIRRTVAEAYLKNQESWQRYQPVHKKAVARTYISKAPLRNWATDVLKLTPSGGYIGTMQIMDLHTRLVFIVPIKVESTTEAIRAVRSWLSQLEELKPGATALVKTLRSDNGSMFKSKEFREFCEDIEIRNIYTTPAAPASNGAVERLNRTVRAALVSTADVKYRGNAKAWVRAVDMVQDAINHTWSRMLGRTPIEAARADSEEVLRDIEQRVQKDRVKRRYTQLYDRARLYSGDYVRLSLRVVGDGEERQSFKSGVRRPVGQANWSEDVYRVHNKTTKGAYKLVGIPNKTFDRMDLLKVLAEEAAKFFDEDENRQG